MNSAFGLDLVLVILSPDGVPDQFAVIESPETWAHVFR